MIYLIKKVTCLFFDKYRLNKEKYKIIFENKKIFFKFSYVDLLLKQNYFFNLYFYSILSIKIVIFYYFLI